MTRRYGAYKDSGVEWIGEIPEHWEVRKLKYISTVRVSSVDKHLFDDELPVTLCNYTDVYKNDFITSAKLESVGTCTAEEFRKFEITKADVLITKDSETPDDIGVPAIVSEELENTVCGYHVAILRPYPDVILGSFLFRQLQTKYARNYFEINSFGITRFGLGKSATEALFVLIPPVYEQSQIVEFLDAKTSLIDRLIDVKQRRIELLKEKRAALINHAVTKGLDPNVKMKDSGIEWIGEIPEHWEVKKLKYFAEISSGDYISSDLINDDGINPVVGGNGIMGYSNEFNFIDKVICVGRVGEKCGNVHLLEERCWINDNALVLEVFDINILHEYIFYQLSTRNLNSLRNQTTQPLITGAMLKNEYLAFPYSTEQEQIVTYLDSETQKIDKLVTLEQKKINLLKEYRQALISETVTGKIKIGKETGG